MNRNLTKRVAAVATTVAMLMAIPGAAFAQTEPTETRTSETERPESLDRLKRRALQAIDKRLETITRWIEKVDNNEYLSADHQAALRTELEAATRGLTALAEGIEEADSYSELGGLIPKIVEDYWVFALLGPKVHLVIGADHLIYITGRFDETAVTIHSAIDRAAGAGFDVADAQAALDRMSVHLAAASLLIDPVAGSILVLQAADMPEARDQLRSAHADLKSGRQELRAARKSAHEAVSAFRDVING